MPPIRARDVSEALEIARCLKAQGKYDWFRGQLQNWPVCPTALRLSEEQREAVLDKLGRFEHWIKGTRGLESLLESPDIFFAVAQHYGLPTNYVDFTTSPEIAAFFAADNSENRHLDRDSCIICLNTRGLINFWKALPSKTRPPEIIEVEVSNLWRLEAQEGRFLFCQYANVEHIYDFDRIVFPYTGPLKSLSAERIYPKEKSSLEILLDQFFMTERMAEGRKVIRSLPGFRAMAHHHVDDTEGVDSEVLAHSLTAHPSWADNSAHSWIDGGQEKYEDTVRSQVYRVRVNEQMMADRDSLRAQFLSILSREALLRRTSVRWEVSSELSLELPATKELSLALNHLWDGLRQLPYSDEQISHALSETIALWHYSDGGKGYSMNQGRTATEKCFGLEVMELEFGAADGSYSRAYASSEFLVTAIRDDIADFLAPSWRDRLMANPASLVQVIRRPELLFDFFQLADFLVRQVVPFQIVFRRHERAIFFSPSRLSRFGRP